MARALTGGHYVCTDRRTIDGMEYQAYVSKYAGATMVLQSPHYPAQPVAAVSILRADSGCRSTVNNNVIAKRDDSTFQWMAGSDEGDLEFVIANLTDFTEFPDLDVYSTSRTKSVGYLKIDILGEDVEVEETNLPCVGVNQVNELRPSEALTIRCDQRTGNHTMMLKGITDDAGADVTVTQSESSGAPETKAARFWIHVTAPARFPGMVALLKDAKWMAADTFVRKIPAENKNLLQLLSMSRGGGIQLQCASGPPTRQVQSYGAPSHGHQLQSLSCGEEECYGPVLTKGMAMPVAPTSSDMDRSQAAKVVRGNRKIAVHSAETDATYDYKQYARTCIVISIWKDMKLRHCFPNDLREEASKQLKDAIDNASRALVDLLTAVFEQDECTVCLDAAPAVVMLMCGHKCLCASCAGDLPQIPDRCYLCRERIVGMREMN